MIPRLLADKNSTTMKSIPVSLKNC